MASLRMASVGTNTRSDSLLNHHGCPSPRSVTIVMYGAPLRTNDETGTHWMIGWTEMTRSGSSASMQRRKPGTTVGERNLAGSVWKNRGE
eukprot:3655821-Rhodomonas_salina.1